MRHLQRSATESLHVSLAKKPISTGTAFAPVLIVEDDEHMRALLKSLTVSLGCRRIADVGAFDKAVERLETEPFALAIIDLHLGDRDGAELIAAIRSHRRAELRTMPILAASTRVSDNRIQAAIAAGADAFLNKPFSILNLQRQILFARAKSDQRLSAAGAAPGPNSADLLKIDEKPPRTALRPRHPQPANQPQTSAPPALSRRPPDH
jgi:CheY-like chemotaxis protein